MEPAVHYVTTADDVRIAYTVSGKGPPLVSCVDPTSSHVQLEWSHPVIGRLQSGTVRDNTLIRFDLRGSGLSDRILPNTLDEWVLDMEAVVEQTGFGKFAMIGVQLAAQVTMSFSVRHPDQVSRLVLLDGYARPAELLSTPPAQALIAAAEADWVLATEAMGSAAFGAGREESRLHGAYIRSCIGPEIISELYGRIAATWDVTELARSIKTPTLVVKHADVTYVTMDMAKQLAANIPNAQLAVLKGGWADDVDGLSQHIHEFINPGAGRKTSTPAVPSDMTAILFADIADSTALTERLGDAAFRAKARDLDAALRTIIGGSAGTPIEGKLLGDGVLAVFTSARQAIEAALACGAAGNREGLPLHLGLHAGDVIREDNNVYGGAVNIASRISGLSGPDEVLVSETVRSLARTSAGVRFEDRGEQSLKGVGAPVRVWAVLTGE